MLISFFLLQGLKISKDSILSPMLRFNYSLQKSTAANNGDGFKKSLIW